MMEIFRGQTDDEQTDEVNYSCACAKGHEHIIRSCALLNKSIDSNQRNPPVIGREIGNEKHVSKDLMCYQYKRKVSE